MRKTQKRLWFGKKTKAKTGESIRQVRAVHKITGNNAKKRSSQIKNSHTWLIQIIYVGKKQKLPMTIYTRIAYTLILQKKKISILLGN